MQAFPAFFPLEGATIVIFGEGTLAQYRRDLLSGAPAKLVTVSRLEALETALQDAKLAFIATEDAVIAAEAVKLAKAASVPVNVMDQPDLCDFTVPSMVKRGQIVAAIGTNGTAPTLGRYIRSQLEVLLPHNIGPLARLAGDLRGKVKAALPSMDARKRYWERTLQGAAARAAYRGDLDQAKDIFEAELHASDSTPKGYVTLVGAGPGDPELLTLKALRALQQADIVFYDRLVGPGVMDMLRREADRVPVGKTKGNHSVPQGEIEAQMIAAAKSGQRVVRLKGGDPFIFGRGGEEVTALRDAGIDVEVVPGISAALGCASAAQIPLTHRDHAQSVRFVTGHAKRGGVPDLDWRALAQSGQTNVIYMGLGTGPQIAQHLIQAGQSPTTPVAVIENGTLANERRVYATLETLEKAIIESALTRPSLLIIGDVVALGRDFALPETVTLEIERELA